jgi:hypothetical protein
MGHGSLGAVEQSGPVCQSVNEAPSGSVKSEAAKIVPLKATAYEKSASIVPTRSRLRAVLEGG